MCVLWWTTLTGTHEGGITFSIRVFPSSGSSKEQQIERAAVCHTSEPELVWLFILLYPCGPVGLQMEELGVVG